ncbi:MAG: zinc-ribbon domain-containing protein [Promethearchaeota archaeon]
MGHKFGYYSIPLPLDEVWNRTLTFWTNNRGKIKDQQFENNNFFRTLAIQRGISATSYGETYQMNFGYNPKESITYVSVEISLSLGYGMAWLKPQGIMKKWALEIGTSPMKLVRSADKKFYEILNDIKNSSIQPQVSSLKKYCHNCGYENQISDNYCKQCGTKLIN